MTNPKPMTFSVNFSSPYDRWGGVAPMGEAAQLADELGFYGVQLGEHIVMPLERVPPGSVVWYDNFVLASYLATLTQRVKLILNVLVIPFRPPVQAAKMISTLDVVSGGRLIVGMGVGHLPLEFQALGVPFSKRGAITNEYVKAMKALWTQGTPEFHGDFVSFSNIAFLPKCVQRPHVRLWVGGVSQAALRRVVELGDGWAANGGKLEELAGKVRWIKEQVQRQGRKPGTLDFAFRLEIGAPDPWMQAVRRNSHPDQYFPIDSPTTPSEIIHAIHQHQEAGFNHLLITFAWRDPQEYMGKMELFAAEVMPAFPAEPMPLASEKR